MKLLDSSKTALILFCRVGFSSSLSIASLRPNSTSSNLYWAVPACCMSVTVESDSSYVLYNLAVAKSNIRTLRSGNEKVANCEPEGEIVIQVGRDFAFLNSNKFVELLYLKTPSGFS